MYLYKAMDDGIPVDPESDNGDVRVIEVDGKPTQTLGIRYKSVDDTPPAAGIQRTKSGRFIDTFHPDETQTEYWADRPHSGLFGGERFRTVLAEDLAVSLFVESLAAASCANRKTFYFVILACV